MKFPDFYRVTTGKYSSPYGAPYGAFVIPKEAAPCNRALNVIADDGTQTGWEHVSVSIDGKVKSRTPSWPEMDFVKRLFWDDRETVIQFHPAAAEKVDYAEVLHLWKIRGAHFQLPPQALVGPLGFSPVLV